LSLLDSTNFKITFFTYSTVVFGLLGETASCSSRLPTGPEPDAKDGDDDVAVVVVIEVVISNGGCETRRGCDVDKDDLVPVIGDEGACGAGSDDLRFADDVDSEDTSISEERLDMGGVALGDPRPAIFESLRTSSFKAYSKFLKLDS
jgi:hypothetical protein